MVVVAVVKAIFAVLKLLITPVNFPTLDVFDDINTLVGYITDMAYNLVWFILPSGTVRVLFAVLLAVIAARYLYAFIMWIIRKIPGGMS